MPSRRIEVCGGIASGKTTLATLLLQRGIRPVLEDYRTNPFWEQFNLSPKSVAFETELTFLLQHFHQMRSSISGIGVHDTSTLQDIAYADVNLSGKEYQLFRAVHQYVSFQLGEPKLIVELRCPAEVLMQRIARRKRLQERALEIGYIEKLNHAIARRAALMRGRSRVLTIDSDKIDFANDPSGIVLVSDLVQKALEQE